MTRILLIWTLLPTLLFSEVLIREDFSTDNLVEKGWLTNSIAIMGPGDYYQMAQLGAVTDLLTSPALVQPTKLSCTVYVTGAAPDFIIEIKSDNQDFQPHPNSPFTITPEIHSTFELELSSETTHIRFSKNGGGRVYLDNIIISDGIPYSESVTLESKQIEQNTTHNLIYAIQVYNPSKNDIELPDLNFEIQGDFVIDEIELAGFKVYQSNDLTVSPEDKLLSTRGRCQTGESISFSLGEKLANQQTTNLLVTVDLKEESYSQDLHHDLKLNPINTFGIFSKLTTGTNFPISQLSTIKDEFTDGDITDWTHNGNFTIETPKFEGDGSSDYQDFATLATKDESGHCVCVKISPIAYGSWEFWIGEGNEWDTAGVNNYSVVLMSDTGDLDALDPSDENFHGYFIKNDNYFSFNRQDGTTTKTLITFGIPNETTKGDSTNKHGGYSFRVTRGLKGNWKFYIDNNDCIPTTLQGSVVDNTYLNSVAFAVRTKVNNPAIKRKLYFDNMVLKSYSIPTIDLTNRVNSYFETIGQQSYIKWISTYTENTVFKLFYQGDQDTWIEVTNVPELADGIYSQNITAIDAENWKLECKVGDQEPQEITLQGSRNQILYSYQLQEGWNLVGPSGCQEFEESLPINSQRWIWANSLYNRGVDCGLTKGMWVKSKTTEDRAFVDSPATDEPVLNTGWNLISFNSDFTYDFTNLLLFYYQGDHYQILEGPVKPFQGYWVFRAE
ncbi:MAG: hypothetical protein KAG98_00105 [Lentisphaeria bacterium]|nr:hypothetical protein [Lentisphaeria bacterium]